MNTEEISKTVMLLTSDTIKESLKLAGAKYVGTKVHLAKVYEEAVLNVGIERLVERLPDYEFGVTAKLMKCEHEPKEKAVKAIQAAGISSLLEKADQGLLLRYCAAMGLDEADKKENIADEVMLTGMEGFLNKLSIAVLRKQCAELKLKSNGIKKDLVERLMVHIFELEPLAAPPTEGLVTLVIDAAPVKVEGNSKEEQKQQVQEIVTESKTKRKHDDIKEEKPQSPRGKAKVKKGEKKADAESRDSGEEEAKQSGDANGTAAEETQENSTAERKSRPPYVAPPLSTIVKGAYTKMTLNDKFNATDLQQYCKEQGLPFTGTKKILLIKRILHYLETGEKDLDKKKPKKLKKKGPPPKEVAANDTAPSATDTTSSTESTSEVSTTTSAVSTTTSAVEPETSNEAS